MFEVVGMTRLLCDAACALFWLAATPFYRIIRRAVHDELEDFEAPPPDDPAMEPLRLPEPPLALLEERVEVWEPGAEWRQRWDAMRP